MKPIPNYDTTQAKGTGDFDMLKLGGHICKIVGAKVAETTTLKEQLELELDIAEGEQKDFYKKQYDSNVNVKKWGCVYRQLTVDSPEYFKGLITAIENSNSNYKWDWDETKLVGKKVGFTFGLEEYTNEKGELKLYTKPRQPRSANKVLEAKIPAVKTLDNTYVDYDEYMKNKTQENLNTEVENKDKINTFINDNLLD